MVYIKEFGVMLQLDRLVHSMVFLAKITLAPRCLPERLLALDHLGPFRADIILLVDGSRGYVASFTDEVLRHSRIGL